MEGDRKYDNREKLEGYQQQEFDSATGNLVDAEDEFDEDDEFDDLDDDDFSDDDFDNDDAYDDDNLDE
jgi:DNA-directed RNA polymerase subunit beta